jgi:Cu-Zn family superoxide dismutase
MKNNLLFPLVATLAATLASADYKVSMNAIDIKGEGAPMGTVAVSAAQGGGVQFTPDLKGLSPGQHGFHVHEHANCGAKEKDRTMSPGEMAGEHYDPKKTHKHAGPQGAGHLGDLPALEVAANATATRPVTSAHLTLRELQGKALVIHEGGDNYSDQPKPNGGGGTRIACGVIQAGEK